MHSNPVKLAAIAAFGAAAFYKASTVVEIFSQNTTLASWLGVVSIIFLFPVIAMFPSKSWARASGYAYCTLGIAAYFMLPMRMELPVYMALFHAASIVGAMWIASASLATRTIGRAIGLLVALTFVSSTLMVPGFPQLLLEFISRLAFLKVIYFPIWLIIAGWFLANRVNMPSLRLIHS